MVTKQASQLVVKTGKFYCPKCMDKRTYAIVRKREMVCLFGIPVYPSKASPAGAICSTCNCVYALSDVASTTTLSRSEVGLMYVEAILKVMAHMMIADDIKDDVEYQMAQRVYEELTASKVSEEAFEVAVKSAEGGEDVFQFLYGLKDYFSDAQKIALVKAALSVAFSDQLFHKTELKTAAKIGSMLGLTAAQVQSTIIQPEV